MQKDRADRSLNGFHKDNLHSGRYPFQELAATHPSLQKHLHQKKNGTGVVIDFADPEAVLCLNQSLLIHFYGIQGWDLPATHLCPGVPGRVDYLHHLSELIQTSRTSHSVATLLDIGTGANGIYALLAAAHFKWSVIASDSNAASLEHLSNILKQNPKLQHQIDLRFQKDPEHVLQGVLTAQDQVTITACNPPFYPSIEAANQAHLQKHLRHEKRSISSHENERTMSGMDEELVYPGGEVAFVKKLIRESRSFKDSVQWFTTLLSKGTSLSLLQRELDAVKPMQQRVIPMQHGNKITRILCWSFNQ